MANTPMTIAADDSDARADQVWAALRDAWRAQCPQVPGQGKNCDHESCAPVQSAALRLKRAQQNRKHVIGRLDGLEQQRGIAESALQHFTAEGDAVAVAYLRSDERGAAPPDTVVEWGQARGLNAEKILRCPLALGGHTWEYRVVPQIPIIDGLIEATRGAFPRVEQEFGEALTVAEQLADIRTNTSGERDARAR